MVKWITAALVLLFSLAARGAGLDISLSDKTAYIVYLTDSGGIGHGGADVGFGLFYNDDDDLLLTANMLVASKASRERPFQFGVGGKFYGGRLDINKDIVALALAAQARYVIPAATPMGISGEVYFAPDITSFADTEDVRELNLRYEIEVIPSTRAYVGYRFLESKVEVDNKERDITLDDRLHVGIRLDF